MKCRVLILALSPAVALAATPLPDSFPDAKIGIPPLSLAEAARQGVPALPAEAATYFSRKVPVPAVPAKRVSNMPIIAPRSDIDLKIRILKPDESVDYKLIVKAPDVEPASRRTFQLGIRIH